MDKDYMAYIYQFIVLISVIALDFLVYIKTGEVNEMITGAIIGLMVGIPMNHNSVKKLP